jgi:hypothetical protein
LGVLGVVSGLICFVDLGGDVGCVQLVNEVCTLFSVVSILSVLGELCGLCVLFLHFGLCVGEVV